MNLTNDYFLLYHGKNAQDIETLSLEVAQSEYYPIYSLILTIKKNNFNKTIKLESFRKLLSHVYTKELTQLSDLYPLQAAILSCICSEKTYEVSVLLEHIKYLHAEKILPQENYNKLLTLFENISQSQNKKEENKKHLTPVHYKEKKERINQTIVSLKELCNNEAIQSSLQKLDAYICAQKFSIGITGVINSGKSTMLNALMGKKILGTSVVPETANLTLLKYATEAKAKVFYWNEEEWENIVHTSKNNASIQKFVQETQDVFGEDIKKYIKKESAYESISVDDISLFTSVKQSKMKCNLVKYVNLYYNLGFLKNGVEIVDTPGLDDPVVQREEITKEYLAQCDVMLHLMNVNQSATLKDIEFIIDAILYQHIAKILIVITQIDSVTPKEVQEVVSYTKYSIEKKLKSLNKSSKTAYILEHIDFIPISAQLALESETQKKQSGIIQLQEYLQEQLFGSEGMRSELIIRTSRLKLEELIARQVSLYEYELEVSSRSKSELESALLTKKDKRESFVQLMKENINIEKNESFALIQRLDNFLKEEFIELKHIMEQRLISDISYTYKTHKKFPVQERIEVILQTAIKDGVIDIIRDYKYKLFKKEELIFTNFEKKIIMFNVLGDRGEKFVDIEEFFKGSFEHGIVTFSSDMLIRGVLELIQNAKTSQLELLYTNINDCIQREFESIEQNISKKLHTRAGELMQSLYVRVLEDIQSIENELYSQEQLIQEQIQNPHEKSDTKGVNLLENIHALQTIKVEVCV